MNFWLKIMKLNKRFNVSGVDDNPQILVANAFKARAALKDRFEVAGRPIF